MAALKYTQENRGGWHVIQLHGSINEDSGEMLRHLIKTAGPQCIFDCEFLQAMNSSGIAEWLHFRTDFDRGRVVVLEKCQPAIIAVLNIIPDMTERTTVRSLFAPFTCTSCGVDTNLLVTLDPGKSAADLAVPATPCGHCGNQLEFNGDPEDYLAFHFSPI